MGKKEEGRLTHQERRREKKMYHPKRGLEPRNASKCLVSKNVIAKLTRQKEITGKERKKVGNLKEQCVEGGGRPVVNR